MGCTVDARLTSQTDSPEVEFSATAALTRASTSTTINTETSNKVSSSPQLFKEIDKNLYIAFIDEIDKAWVDSETWMSDPSLVVENFMQWPAGEPGCRQERITEVSRSEVKAEYVIENFECPDDSVRDMAYYVELTDKGSYWTISWIGMIWRCARAGDETLNNIWHTQACP